MTQRELRNIIVKQLHTYLAGPKVVLSDQTAPEADYPLIYYQSVQQYRNQINHATDSAVKFQKDTGLLPLSTSAIEQTLGDVAFYLFKLKECKATAPVGIELLDSNKAF